MLSLRHNLKLFIFFLLFSIQQHPFLWWNQEENPTLIAFPNTHNNTLVSSQTMTKGTVDARIFITQGSVVSDIAKLFNSDNISDNINAVSNTIKIHWFKIIVASLLTSYIYILYQIRYTCALIKEHNAWCNWKSVIPVTHLQLTAREELLSQLKIEIYKKYARSGLDTLTCDYKTMFIQDINFELKTLDTYLDWKNRIQTISCNMFFNFPFDVTTIEEKKARLFFILDLFMIAQAEKS